MMCKVCRRSRIAHAKSMIIGDFLEPTGVEMSPQGSISLAAFAIVLCAGTIQENSNVSTP